MSEPAAVTERLHRTLIDLCRIPSPSRRERRVAQYVIRRLEELGLTAEEDDGAAALEGDCGNLFVRQTAGRGEPVFLCAHLDTVAVPPGDTVPVIVEPERIHTGGASPLGGDDKMGVALALEMLARSVEAPGTMRPFEVVFTVQEEIGCRGSGHVDPARLAAREGFILDGEGAPFSAIRRAPTKEWFRVEVTGRRSHAAVDPEAGINAIRGAGAAAAAVPCGRLSAGSVANVGSLSGGGPTNVVPDRAELVGELRSLSETEQARWRRRIERAVQRAMRRHRTTARIDWSRAYAGYTVPDDSPSVRIFTTACRALGGEPVFLESLGGGDANPFNAKGLRCIVFGLGMEAIHSPEEVVLWSRLDLAAALLERTLTP